MNKIGLRGQFANGGEMGLHRDLLNLKGHMNHAITEI